MPITLGLQYMLLLLRFLCFLEIQKNVPFYVFWFALHVFLNYGQTFGRDAGRHVSQGIAWKRKTESVEVNDPLDTW